MKAVQTSSVLCGVVQCLWMWWCSPPGGPPGDVRRSQCCVPALVQRAVNWDHQALPDRPWSSCCLDCLVVCLVDAKTVRSGKYWSCRVAAKTAEPPDTSCVRQNGIKC